MARVFPLRCRQSIMSEAGTVYILDDEPAVRDAISVLVKSVRLNALSFESADAFLAVYDTNIPACLITDVYLPGIDGVALQKQLIKMNTQLPIIVMSGHGDIPLAVKMIRRGALDFIEKPFNNHHILERIQQALSLDAERRNHTSKRNVSQQLYETLTPREKEVLALLIVGLPNKVIAAKMLVSPRTIETHRANILRKMEADSVVLLAQQTACLRLPEIS